MLLFAATIGSISCKLPNFSEEEKEKAIFLLTIKSVFYSEEGPTQTICGTTRIVGQIARRSQGDKQEDNSTERHLAGIANREENYSIKERNNLKKFD